MRILLSILLVSLFVACENPTAEQAEVAEAQEIEQPEVQEDQVFIAYRFKTEASEVNWTGRKPTGKHNGTIGIKSGYITVVEDSIVGGKFVLDMEDIDVIDLRSDEDSQMKLISHLRSADFFEVEKYPTATFEITAVTEIDSANQSDQEKLANKIQKDKNEVFLLDDPTHKVTGNLTLKDTTLSITFPAYILHSPEQLIAKARFSIDRTLWGVNYREEAEFTNKIQDQLIYNDVNVGLEIIANPEKEAF